MAASRMKKIRIKSSPFILWRKYRLVEKKLGRDKTMVDSTDRPRDFQSWSRLVDRCSLFEGWSTEPPASRQRGRQPKSGLSSMSQMRHIRFAFCFLAFEWISLRLLQQPHFGISRLFNKKGHVLRTKFNKPLMQILKKQIQFYCSWKQKRLSFKISKSGNENFQLNFFYDVSFCTIPK